MTTMRVPWWRKILALLGSPASLTGLCTGFALGGIEGGLGGGLAGALIGALYALAVLGLIRCFRIVPGLYWAAGLVCGPVPLVLVSQDVSKEDVGGLLLLAALFGALVGLIEWAHARHSAGRGGATLP